jgi:hypothetical protein
MRRFMAIGSGCVCAFFGVEANRLWTADPHQAYAAAGLAAFMFTVCLMFRSDVDDQHRKV